MSRHISSSPDNDKFDSYNTAETETFNDATTEDDDELDQIPIRPRQRFTQEETEYLEEVYQQTARPTTQMKQELANMFDTAVNRIQIWFQNRRAKAKKTSPLNQVEEGQNKTEAQSNNPFKKDDSQCYNSSKSSQEAQDSSSNKLKRKRPYHLVTSQAETSYLRQPTVQADHRNAYPTEVVSSPLFADESSRYTHPASHRESDAIHRNYYFPLTRIFREVSTFPPLNLATTYLPNYLPNYDSPFLEERPNSTANDNNSIGTSFIDPQKMLFSKEFEVSTNKPVSYSLSQDTISNMEEEENFKGSFVYFDFAHVHSY